MIRPPEHIQSIKPYVPGKPVEELQRELGIDDAVKLASNENPLGPSPKAVEAIYKVISGLNRYPDGNAFYLKNALSAKLAVDQERLIIGNGSNELIDIAVRTFVTAGDEAIMGVPSFVVYPMAAQSVGARAVQVPLKEWRHDLDAMAGEITERTRIIFVANPNNPTGTINHTDEFDEFMRRVPDDVLVIVDEAYREYVQDGRYPDVMKYLETGRDILILRTFSKVYGLAGLRIGYGISGKEIVREMNKVREPFNTSSVAQAAAIASVKDSGHVERSIAVNEEGKAYLYKEFRRLGLDFVATEANFIYVTFDRPVAANLYNHLLKRGVIIRPIGAAAVRITVGLPGENRLLVEALGAVIGKVLVS